LHGGFELPKQLQLSLFGLPNHVAKPQGKRIVGVMNSYYANLFVDVVPGLAVVSVALLAALPPYRVMCQSSHGRARGAIAYILGFFAGLAATFLIAGTVGAQASDHTPILAGGLLASFFAPFGGMLRGRLRRPVRRQARGQAYSR
jgi:hypothetical protein